MSRRSFALRAFTLIELLVVVAIIALLIAILIPSLGAARKNAKNSVCMANLHGNAITMLNYAAEFGGLLPNEDVNGAGGGLILWDVTHTMADNLLARSGNLRTSYYCPLSPDQNIDSLWNFNATYRVMGYYYFNRRKNTTLQTLDSGPGPKYSKLTTTGKALMQDQELISDVVISVIGTNNFGEVTLSGLPGHPFTTSHLSRGAKPEGGNIVFIDGHVEWRPFVEMKNRYQSTKAADPFIEWF